MDKGKYNTRAEKMYGPAIGDGAKVINYFGKTFPKLSEEERRPLLQEYRAHLRHRYAELDLRGVPLSDGVHMPIDQVYIRLRARPREKQERPPDERALAEYVRRQQEQRRKWEKEARRAEAIAPEAAVHKHAQLVILGPPGAGKTTFLRHLAWAEAEGKLLPLLVPLGQVDAAVGNSPNVLDAALELLTQHKAGETKEKLQAALVQEIEARHVLWLWDALDEVRAHREQVEETLASLVADGHRMILTSRPLSYVSLPGLEAVYDVLPLQAEAARAFVERWFRALAEARGRGEAWAKGRQQWLERQLAERPGLREVARNPLMLTFLAVLAGGEKPDIPRHRKELYARFIEEVITSWETRKRGGEEVPLLDDFDKPKQAKRMALWGFRRIALHLHLAYTTGRVKAASREVTWQGLVKAVQDRRPAADPWEVEGQAEAILDFWQQAGLLDSYTLRGVDYLAFRHLTFQEYGAARALAETYYGDDPALWTVLEPHLLEDDWAEVIPLTLAHLEDATPLVARLLEANTRDKDRQRPLFRAAAAIADGANVAEDVKRRVIDGLAHLARTMDSISSLLCLASSLGNPVTALERLESEGYATEVLLAIAHDGAVDAWIRVRAAEALTEQGRVGEVVPILLAIAQDGTLKARARVYAAEALGEMGRVEEAISILLAMAQDGAVDGNVREEAAEALVDLGRAEEAMPVLLALAQDKKLWPMTRVQAAATLAELGHVEKTTPIFLALAQDETANAIVRVFAAEVLAELGRVEEGVPILRAIAKDKEVDEWTRHQAAKVLRRWGYEP